MKARNCLFAALATFVGYGCISTSHTPPGSIDPDHVVAECGRSNMYCNRVMASSRSSRGRTDAVAIAGRCTSGYAKLLAVSASDIHNPNRYTWYAGKRREIFPDRRERWFLGYREYDHEPTADDLQCLRYHIGWTRDADWTLMERTESQQTLPPVSGTRGTPAAYAPAAPGIPER